MPSERAGNRVAFVQACRAWLSDCQLWAALPLLPVGSRPSNQPGISQHVLVGVESSAPCCQKPHTRHLQTWLAAGAANVCVWRGSIGARILFLASCHSSNCPQFAAGNDGNVAGLVTLHMQHTVSRSAGPCCALQASLRHFRPPAPVVPKLPLQLRKPGPSAPTPHTTQQQPLLQLNCVVGSATGARAAERCCQ